MRVEWRKGRGSRRKRSGKNNFTTAAGYLILDDVANVGERALPLGAFEFERLHAFRHVYLALVKQPAAASSSSPDLRQTHGRHSLPKHAVTGAHFKTAGKAGEHFFQQLRVTFRCTLEQKRGNGKSTAANGKSYRGHAKVKRQWYSCQVFRSRNSVVTLAPFCARATAAAERGRAGAD